MNSQFDIVSPIAEPAASERQSPRSAAPPPLKVVGAEEMRSIDRAAIEERGFAGADLMERAGEAIWSEARDEFEPAAPLVLCGKGNNGCDGFVVARLAAEAGRRVRVLLFGAGPEALAGDAKLHFDRLPEAVRPKRRAAPGDLREALDAAPPDLIVDALLGTGVAGTVRGDYAEAIDIANEFSARRRVPILAADIPSGVPADAGWDGEGVSIQAAMTVTIGLPKIGMLVEPGARRSGRVKVAPINFPPDLLASDALKGHLLTPEHVQGILPERRPDGHKGTFGRCLVAGGSLGLAGAPALAARAALRAGAGLVFAAVPWRIYDAVLPVVPEAIFVPAGGEGTRYFDPSLAEELLSSSVGRDAAAGAVGPGLGLRNETVGFARRFIANWGGRPLVVDADALVALRDAKPFAAERSALVLLTPHPGELSRMTGESIGAIQADRVGAAVRAARRWNCLLLLKGAHSVIAEPDGRYYINPTGNSGLAKGGSGDALTGIVASLAAQGATLSEAVRAGAFLHGLSADLLAERSHPRSMLASEVADNLGGAFRHLERVAGVE